MERRALEILEDALAQPQGAARAALVAERCGEDRDLLARVRALLVQVDCTETGLSGEAGGSEPTRLPPARRRIGQRIGPFRLIDVIGHGGMGVVYLAERVDGGFEQRVALKLIRADTPVLAQRFLRERSILARLGHPGIARLVDGGFTDEGQAWFAMEHVRGEAITTWCDGRRLDLRARARLLARVGEAVQSAHRSLVVHRDIKPANILVDGSGEPRLLDFGIARLLDETGGPLHTLSLTPAYASPEQIRGEPVSTACDVYQLGLVLFELLSGIPAHEARSRAGADATATVPRPDQALKALLAADPERARHLASLRRASPERLLRQLRGDLARILGKALAPSPQDRYDTVAALVQDLQRWLAGLPVRARRGHILYRTGKFLRRNQVASIALTLLFAGAVWHLVQLAASNRQIRVERDQAQAIAGFMQEMFSAADPRIQPQADTTARELLDLGASRVAGAATMPADTRAGLLATVARSYQSIGLYPEARALYAQALELLDPDDRAQRAQLARILAAASQADTDGNWQDNALRHHDLAQRLLERLGPGDGLAHAHALSALAGSLLNQRRFEEAVQAQDRLLALRNRLFDQDPSFFSEALLTSAGTLEVLQRPEQAAERTRQAVAAYRLAFGVDHPDYGRALAQLADQQTDLHRYEEARANYREGIDRLRRTLGDDHRDVGIKLNNLALMEIRLGRFAEAQVLLDEALPILRTVFGDDNAYVAAALNNRGTALLGLQRLDQAAADLDEAWAIIAPWPDSAYFPRVQHARARLACARGDLEAALDGFRAAAARYGDDRFRAPALAWHRIDCLRRHDRTPDDLAAALAGVVAQLRDGLGEAAWDTRQATLALAQLSGDQVTPAD
ncbi:MAG: serine/threonine protein kinase [Xanthomonadales bacterium]|nr:serine/threonine protein kinase [Xanthomonadales bacterium]